MTVQQVPLSTMLRQIAEVDRVYVRMALTRDNSDRLGVRSLLVDVFPQVWLDNPDDILANWQSARFRYEYKQAVLLSEFVESAQVHAWFGGGECRLARFDMRPGYRTRILTFDMLELHDSVTAIPHHSYGKDGFVAMPWPHTTYTCTVKGATNTPRNSDYEPLVAPAVEYFESFQAARAEVIHGIGDPTQIYNFRGDEVAVRVVHADGWLNEIRIGQNEVTAVVHGINLLGSSVVLSGAPEMRQHKAIYTPGTVILPIPRDLPRRMIVALTRGDEELDRVMYMSGQSPYAETSPQVVVERDDAVEAVSDVALLDTMTPEFFSTVVERDKTIAKAEPVANDSASDEHPKVFISYSHDTAQHARRILAFADSLRRDGIDCNIDQYEEDPPQGWPQWMEDQIEWAEYVLVVCTQTYTKRFRGKETLGKGLGATWEGAILTQQLYNQAAKNSTIIPVVFSPEDVAQIPTVLQGTSYYNVSEGPQFTKLYRRLTKQPLVVKPPLGRIKRLPQRDVESE